MASYSHATQKDCIRFADEIFDVPKAKTIDMPTGDVQAFVNDLQCLLDIVGVSNRLCINDSPTFHEQLCRWQEEVDWKPLPFSSGIPLRFPVTEKFGYCWR